MNGHLVPLKKRFVCKSGLFFLLSKSKNPVLFLWQLDIKASVLNARHHWVNEGYASMMPGN